MKKKTYVLMVSKQFPAYHKRKGEETNFVEKILVALNSRNFPFPAYDPKIHTIRKNYTFWEKRIKNILDGKAVLSIRYWLYPGGCYKKGNKQIEICKLDEKSGIGIQKLEDPKNFVYANINEKMNNWEDIAKNDGLSCDDFGEWFKKCPDDLMAIIHFTDFRY